jgi:hypothetical protein
MSPSEIKEILHKIDIRPGEADNRKLTEVLPILFQLIERLSQENKNLKAKNRKLRDEISLLKGQQVKPKIRGNKKPVENISSEKEGKRRKSQRQKSTRLK